VTVEAGGCSGFQYHLQFTRDGVQPEDLVFTRDGAEVLSFEAARRWLDEHYVRLECEPLRGSGKGAGAAPAYRRFQLASVEATARRERRRPNATRPWA
jgi:hypothetical protein